MYNYDISLHKEGIINPKKLGYGALCFVLEGKAILTLNQKTYTFTVGDLFYLQDNDNYLPVINDGLVAVLHIGYSMMESLSGEESYLYWIPKTTKTNQLNKYKHQIKDLFIRAILADLTNIKIRRSHYIVEIYKIMYERFKEETNYYGQTEMELTGLIRKVKQYVDKHYQEKLSLNLVADFFFISPEHLSREFSRQIGTTFTQYLKETRLFQTTYALLFTQFKVEQIADYHGFSSYHNFNRQFKEQFQLTPKQYRLMYQQKKISKKTETMTEDERKTLISKLQKMMHNKSLVHEYKHLTFKDLPLQKLKANHKTYLHIGDVNDFYTPFLGTILETVENIPRKPIIVIHCSLKSFFCDIEKHKYRHNLAFCLSMFSDTNITPCIKIYDFDVQDHMFKSKWSEFIDVIHNYFVNKQGEFYFDIKYDELTHIQSQINDSKESLPDLQIMINGPDPFKHDYEQLDIDMQLCKNVDSFAISYSFNELFDFNKMNNHDIAKIKSDYTEKFIHNLKFMKNNNKNVVPIEWNVIHGDSRTTSDFYFNAAIIVDHLLSITTYVSGLGFWLLEETSADLATINQPLSLHLKHHCKSPVNYLIYILTYFNQQEFEKGQNYIKFEQHNKIFFLLFNYELYNPNDINYQNNVGISLSYRDIPFNTFRVTNITFDQDNGNIFKAIRKLDNERFNIDYFNTVLLDKYCSPDIEMADYNSKDVDETYYLKTNAIKLLIIQKRS